MVTAAMPRLVMAGVVIASSLVLSACSAVRMAYDSAPWLLMRSVNDYLDLDTPQEERLRAQLDAYHVVHRQERLPGVVDALREIGRRGADGMSEADWQWALEFSPTLYRDTAGDLLPLVGQTLAGLDTPQIDYLEERLKERNESYSERYLAADPQERLENRVGAMVKQLERWVGKLNEEQVALITELRSQMPETGPLWLNYRRQKQGELLAALRADRPAPELSAILRGWWLERDGQSPELAAARVQWREGMEGILRAVERSLTDEQREYFVSTVNGYADSLSAT